MITKEQIDKVLNPRGYTCHAYTGDRKEYYYNKIGTGITVIVHTERNTFELVYILSNFIFKLVCPECGPFYEETPTYNQFDKMYDKFKIEASKLQS